MSGEKLTPERGAFTGGGYVEYTGQVNPLLNDGSLESKFRSLLLQLRIQMYKEEAHTEARIAAAKWRDRNQFIPHTGGFL